MKTGKILLGLWLLFFSSAAVAQEATDFASGVRSFAQGQLNEARRFFESSVRAQPENPLGAFYLGRIAFEEQRFDQAVEWFKKTVQQDGENSEYHLWLGRAYGYQAMRSSVFIQPFLALKVKAHFEKAVELDPNNLDARADLKEYYEKAPGFLGGSAEKARQQAEEIAKREQQRAQR